MKSIAITGASGFVGVYLSRYLRELGYHVTCFTRSGSMQTENCQEFQVGPLENCKPKDLAQKLKGIDTVVHLAGRAHVMSEEGNTYHEYKKANVDATTILALACQTAGIKNLIYFSSIKVNGEETHGHPFTELDPPSPRDDYGKSKLQAEEVLSHWSEKTQASVQVIRPPLIYGAGVKGNLNLFKKLIDLNIPIPLGAFIQNKRSLISLPNLSSAVQALIEKPTPGFNVYLIKEAQDFSTRQIMELMAEAGQKKPIFLNIPIPLIRIVLGLLGKRSIFDRLNGNLQVDSSKLQQKLSWTPKNEAIEGFIAMMKTSQKPYYPLSKAIFDKTFAFALLLFLAPIFLIIAALVKVTSTGPIFYYSDRIGRDNRIFSMPKFRTMKIHTPQVATHLLTNPKSYLTPVGNFLRKSSLDELPQLLAVLNGDMSIVGPRPALFNQEDLISLRTQNNVHRLKPGVTGWAQINGRDDIEIPQKVKLDFEYLNRRSLLLDFIIIVRTLIKVFTRDGVAH